MTSVSRARRQARDGVELFADIGGVWLGEDGADGRGDHLRGFFGDLASTLRRKWTRLWCHQLRRTSG